MWKGENAVQQEEESKCEKIAKRWNKQLRLIECNGHKWCVCHAVYTLHSPIRSFPPSLYLAV